LRENQLLYSSHLPLGVPNGLVIHHEQGPSAVFSGAVAGEEVEDFCKGSFRTHILYFVIVLLYFIYFTCIALYQKPKN
jgi:hypothetical protein